MGTTSHGRGGSSVSGHHRCIATLRGHSSYVSALASHGSSLYSGSADRHIRAWTSGPSGLDSEPSHAAVTCCKSPVKSLLVSGDTMFSSHQDHRIRIWHIKPCCLQLAGSLPTAKDRILSLLSPHRYVRARRHEKRAAWVQHADAVSALAVSADRSLLRLLCSVSWDRTIKIWRLSDLRCIESVPKAHHDAINAVVMSDDGLVYTGSADTTVKVWEKRAGQKKHTLVDTLEGHRSAVNALALIPDGSVLYSGACDRSVVVWERVDGRRRAVVALRGHAGAVLCLAVAGDLVCSGSADRTVRVWRGGEGYTCLAVLDGHRGPVKSLATGRREGGGCEDGEGSSWLVYSGSLDCEIKVWMLSVPSNDVHPFVSGE